MKLTRADLLEEAYEWGVIAIADRNHGFTDDSIIATAHAELAAWHASRMP